MIPTLTPAQLNLLRRCDGGLRVWETGERLLALRTELRVLCELRLVSLDEQQGYQLTPSGEACLVRLGS